MMPTQDFKGTINGVLPNQIVADGVAGRVLRQIIVYLSNGTDASTLKAETASLWNGDVNAEVNNISKGATTGVWSLSADGSALILLDSGISGNAVASLSTQIILHTASATVFTLILPAISGGLYFAFINPFTAAALDLTALVDVGIIRFHCTYLTSA